MPEKISTKNNNNLFTNKNFILLLLINILVIFSDKWAQTLIQATEIKGNHIITTMMSILPYIFFSPLAGYLADKYKKKDILVFSTFSRVGLHLLIFLILIFDSLYAAAYHLPKSPIITNYFSPYSFSFIFLIPTVFINIITFSLIPNIVQKSNLRIANALFASLNIFTISFGRYCIELVLNPLDSGDGPAVVVAAIVIGILLVFGHIISSIISLILAKFIKAEENQAIKEDLPESKTKFIESFKSTIAYLKTHQKTKRTIELACALSLLTSVFYIALIALAQDKLNTLLIMIGAGMLLGVIGINFLQNKFKLNDLLTFSFIVLVIGFGTAQFVNSIEMAWFWLIPIGIVNVIINMLIETAIQKTVPNRFRGKVFGFKAFITNLVFVICLVIISQFVLVKIPPIELIHGLAYFAFSITSIILFFRRNFVYYVLRLLFKPIMYSFFQLKIKGREHLKHKGSLILAGNHTGWLDGFIVGTASKRNLEFMVTSEVLSWPIISHVARALAFIPVFDGQGKNALKEAIDDLKCGKAICIFPEGKLSEDGSIAKFNRGVARLQTKSQAPIIPFAIHGGFEAWSYHHKLPRFHKIIIEFGEPLYYTEEKDEKSIIDELRQKVINLKNNLL
jgi:1-acyl-sn-glycerol-3-phosphate acyltransferase